MKKNSVRYLQGFNLSQLILSIRQLKGKHKQIALQWIPGHCQITGHEQADLLAKKGAKITQTYIRETPYHSNCI